MFSLPLMFSDGNVSLFSSFSSLISSWSVRNSCLYIKKTEDLENTLHTDAKSYEKSFVNVVRVNDFIIPTTNPATCTRMCAQYSLFLIFGFNSNQKEHLDSLSLHSTGHQVDWHFRRSKFVLRPFIGRPNCASIQRRELCVSRGTPGQARGTYIVDSSGR